MILGKEEAEFWQSRVGVIFFRQEPCKQCGEFQPDMSKVDFYQRNAESFTELLVKHCLCGAILGDDSDAKYLISENFEGLKLQARIQMRSEKFWESFIRQVVLHSNTAFLSPDGCLSYSAGARTSLNYIGSSLRAFHLVHESQGCDCSHEAKTFTTHVKLDRLINRALWDSD